MFHGSVPSFIMSIILPVFHLPLFLFPPFPSLTFPDSNLRLPLLSVFHSAAKLIIVFVFYFHVFQCLFICKYSCIVFSFFTFSCFPILILPLSFHSIVGYHIYYLIFCPSISVCLSSFIYIRLSIFSLSLNSSPRLSFPSSLTSVQRKSRSCFF